MGQPARAGVYFCRQPSRCVVPLPGGDSRRHKFAVGTCSLLQRNEIHNVDVEFSEDSVDVQSSQVLEHDGEVWLMSPCPSDGRQLLTYSAGQGTPKLRLWRTDAEEKALQLVASVTDDNTALTMVKSILWDAHSEDSVVVADAESLHVFKKKGRRNIFQQFIIGCRPAVQRCLP